MFAIARKEFSAFFRSSTGGLILLAYLGLNGIVLWTWRNTGWNLLDSGYAHLDGLFIVSPMLFLILIPGIGMRMLAEERQRGTMEWLLTQPLTEWQIIFGKWLAGVALIALAIAPTLLYAITIDQLGEPAGILDIGSTLGAYMGLLMIGATYMAISIFASSLTDNVVTALLLSIALCAALFWLFDLASQLAFFRDNSLFWVQWGMLEHYRSISRGVLESRDIIYFLGAITVFLGAARLSLQRRMWS